MKTRFLIILSVLVLIPANGFAQDGAYELEKPLCLGGPGMVLDENCVRIRPSPYAQQQDGTEPKDVRCNHDLYRGYKTSDGTAFCASGYSLNQLIYREYAEPFDSINAATVSGKNYVVNGYCPASSELLQYGWYPYDNPTDIVVSNIDLNYDPEEDSRSVEFTFEKMNNGAAMVWVFVECDNPKSNPEPEPVSTDQQNLTDARDKLREAYHANVSWGSFNIKDAIVGYGIGDGFLVVDILEKYYNSDRKLIEEKIIDITGGDVDIEFNSSIAIVPTSESEIMKKAKELGINNIMQAVDSEELSYDEKKDYIKIRYEESPTQIPSLNIRIKDFTRNLEYGERPTFTVIETGYAIPCTHPTLEVYYLKQEIGNEHTSDDLVYEDRIMYSCPFFDSFYPVLKFWDETDFEPFPMCEKEGRYLVVGDSGYERMPLDEYYCGMENEN